MINKTLEDFLEAADKLEEAMAHPLFDSVRQDLEAVLDGKLSLVQTSDVIPKNT